MTEIEQLRAEVEQLKAALADGKRISTQYLQNVAHQLTAPLGAIKWSIEAIKDEDIPVSKKLKLLSSVYSQASILVHLIKNFALMSNLEADHELGEFREQPEKADIFRICINLANDFQPQALDADKKIEVDEDSFIRVLGVRHLLIVKNLIAQAASNLLENAVKYSDKSTLISVFARKLGETCDIVVESRGIAVLPTEIAKVINRGYRGTEAKQKVPAGTGIGLYLASRIMRLHDGSLIVEADGNKSRFILRFPWARVVK